VPQSRSWVRLSHQQQVNTGACAWCKHIRDRNNVIVLAIRGSAIFSLFRHWQKKLFWPFFIIWEKTNKPNTYQTAGQNSYFNNIKKDFCFCSFLVFLFFEKTYHWLTTGRHLCHYLARLIPTCTESQSSWG